MVAFVQKHDSNGNRITANSNTYSTGVDNRLLFDGTFNYTYDAEGNRLSRVRLSNVAADDYRTEYTYDYRNRLTNVTFKNNLGVVTKSVDYTYDYLNRRIMQKVDGNGAAAGGVDYTYNVYQGDNAALEINDLNGLATSGTGENAPHRQHRYLYGSAVDEILASENTAAAGNATGAVLWGLGDNQGTIRDIVDSATRTVIDHRKFDSFGTITSEIAPTTDFIFGYTGQALDKATGLSDFGHRWYDAALGRFVTEDPSGFSAGDMNLYRYVNNNPWNNTDPSGLCGFSMFNDYSFTAAPASNNLRPGYGLLAGDIYPGYVAGSGPEYSSKPIAVSGQTQSVFAPGTPEEYIKAVAPKIIANGGRLEVPVAPTSQSVTRSSPVVMDDATAWSSNMFDFPNRGLMSNNFDPSLAPFLATSTDRSSPYYIQPNYSFAIGVATEVSKDSLLGGVGLVSGVGIAEAPAIVGGSLLAGGTGWSLGSRAGSGQSFGQVIGGSAADVFGVNLAYRVGTGNDIATGNYSPASPGEVMFAGGMLVGGGVDSLSNLRWNTRSTSAPVVVDNPTSQSMVQLYHQGTLNGGVVSGNKSISTSPSSALTHYNPEGQLYKFEIPQSVYNGWMNNGWIQPFTDLHAPTGIITPEIRIYPPASGQMNQFMVPKLGE